MFKEKLLSSIENTNGTISKKMTSHNINFFILIGVVILSSFTYMVFGNNFEDWQKKQLIKCQNEFMSATNDVVKYNETNPSYKVPLPVYDCSLDKQITSSWTHSTGITVPPERQGNEVKDITMRDRFWLWHCRFTNSHHELKRYNLNWIGYDIACTPWVSFDIKSPWEYTIEKIGYWHNMGNYIILKKSSEVGDEQTRIVLAHTITSRKVWEKLAQWDTIGQTNISWESTWMHVHIELWSGYMNVDRNFALWKEYKAQNGTALLNHRNWDFWQPKDNVYYFTSYNLWDVNQNDSSPCIGASGKDLCSLEASGVRTMALTADIRKKIWVNYGDKVRLTWESGCSWVYEVHDEMNKRFRETPWVRRPWTPYYIKWDLPSKEGWVCHIEKI